MVYDDDGSKETIYSLEEAIRFLRTVPDRRKLNQALFLHAVDTCDREFAKLNDRLKAAEEQAKTGPVLEWT